MVTDIWNPIDEETLRELAQLGASKRAPDRDWETKA